MDFDEHTLAPAAIELSIKNLFPRAQIKPALGDGDDHFAPHDLAFEVASLPDDLH